MRYLWLTALIIAGGILPVAAQKQLVVGHGGTSWLDARQSSDLVETSADSIWIWKVEPGENLAPGTLGRGGLVRASGIRQIATSSTTTTDQQVLLNTTEVQALLDGDPSTAFNPDEAGLEREVEVYIDLGGTFGIDRVRLFPRLDNAHLGFMPQTFDLGLGDRLTPLAFLNGILNQRFAFLIRYSPTRPNDRAVIDWPGQRQVSGRRQARYLRYQPLSGVPWEIAELKIFSDGSVPTGEYLSLPLLASSGRPVWGRVHHEGDLPLEELPVVIQTRTGPDEEPLHYYAQTALRSWRVTRVVWENIEEIPGAAVKGPVVPNPAWSAWETVTDGVVRSPSPNRYLQFRVSLLESGAKLERLIFEYSTPPLVARAEGEISPLVVEAGVETPFTLSLELHRVEEEGADTGFRFIDLLTPAEIVAIDSVRVDDRTVVHSARLLPGEGASINLWRRVLQDGAFVQIFFRGRIFVDGTRFGVRLLDRRQTPDEEEASRVYQFIREGDVDLLTLGAQLSVRLASNDNPLIDRLRGRSLFTPNGDGINDIFSISYNLLKLTRPAPVFFEIFDLSGNRVVEGFAGEEESGRSLRVWDGRDASGSPVEPGLYLYRLQVEADAETATRQGVVGVAY